MPAYNTRLWIVVSNSITRSVDVIEDLVDYKVMSKADRRSVRAYVHAIEDPNGVYHVIIFVNHNSGPGEVAHEAKHALNLIFKWHGVFLSTHNDESECYHLEWIVNRVHNSIKQYPTKPKKHVQSYCDQCGWKAKRNTRIQVAEAPSGV